MGMKFGSSKKKAKCDMSGLIAEKVMSAMKVAKLNLEGRVVLRRLELVYAAPEPAVTIKEDSKVPL